MANRYWVGGTGNWSDNINHWASTSNGPPGASKPTSDDNVYFDQYSFTATGQIVNLNEIANCFDMDWTGALNNPVFSGTFLTNIYGSFTFNENASSEVTGIFSFNSTSLGETIDTKGVPLKNTVNFAGIGGEWTLLSDIDNTNTASIRTINVSSGSLITNNKKITTYAFASLGSATRSISLGSSEIVCIRQNSTTFNCATPTGLTFDAGTSKIILTGNSVTFAGGGLTYNNVEFQGALTTISGSNTFNDLKLTAGKTVKFTEGSTQTINTMSGDGTFGNLITLESVTAGSPATISCASGTIIKDYWSIKDSTATGGATFYAKNSLNVSGNTGWSFLEYCSSNISLSASVNISEICYVSASSNIVSNSTVTCEAFKQIGTLTDADTTMFYFNGKLFFMNGTDYKYYDGSTFGTVASIAYVPTIAINAPPTGGGTLFEEANNLTGKKKQTFLSPGTVTDYTLEEQNIDATLLIITVNGVTLTEITNFTVNRTTGVVTFLVAPVANAEVIIQWEKASTAQVSLVTANRAATIFGPGNDTTVFVWGNPANKNRRTFSGTLDATYWPVNNYTLIGSDEYSITDMQPQYDRLIIFKENESFYSVPEYNSTLVQYDYPAYNLNYAIGNVAFNGVQVIRNNPVSLYRRSVWEWVSTQVKDERNATDRGERMTQSFASIDFTTAITFDHQDKQELWINVGSLVYIWNYDNDTWYMFDNITANCFVSIDGVLYYGTKDGKIEAESTALNDNGTAITAVYKTGFMDFGAYEYSKTSRDMWFTISPASRTSITIKCPTNKKNEGDSTLKEFTRGYALFSFVTPDFAEWTFKTNYNPQPFRIKLKAKKYAYIQIIVENAEVNESLTLVSIKMTSELGSYTK